jgi:Ca2+-binding RTX toxin-like protein
VSLDCGSGDDLVLILGAYSAGSFKSVANCERFEGVTDPARIAELREVIDRARNRGRSTGDEASVAAGSPSVLAADFNTVQGTVADDAITTREPLRSQVPLGISRDRAGNLLTIVQRPPASGRLTDRDLVFGKAGDDVIRSGPGNDHLEGEDGNDTLYGQAGNDLLYGRARSDRLLGEAGDDLLEGARGNDRLSGGSGDDQLNGGLGTDKLSGGPGNDRLTSIDLERDTLDCGSGRDTAIVDSRDRTRGCERVTRRR